MSELSYMERRLEMCELVQLMYDRRLTNAAGGNVSERVEENRLLITPSMMSEHKRCRLKPEDLMVIDYDMNIIEGSGVLSRESQMHTLVLRSFPEMKACIHAHPQYSMIFAALGKPIPSMTEATMKMGECGVVERAVAYSADLAKNVYEYFLANRDRMQKMGLQAILPLHGTVCVGKSLSQAYGIVERVEYDAMACIFEKILGKAL